MMFKKRIKDHAKGKFNSIVKDPSFVKKDNSIKKPVSLKNRSITAIGISLAVVFAGVIATIIVVPKILSDSHTGYLSSNVNNPKAHTLFLLATNYTEENCEIPSVDNDVAIIKTWGNFQEYITLINFGDIQDFSEEINKSTFQENNVLAISFFCCSAELNHEKKNDGRGPEIHEIEILDSDNVIFKFSVPTFGYDEAINKVTFFAVASKNAIDDDFRYIYDVTQRNTGQKGSSYYNENGKMNYRPCGYMDLIDSLSSIRFDYKNPNYGKAIIHNESNHVYELSSDQTYDVVSTFNDIPLRGYGDFHGESIDNDFKNNLLNSIEIEVTYHYVTQTNEGNVSRDDALVHFYVFENGQLAFLDRRKIAYWCSDLGLVNYSSVAMKIKTGGALL